MQSQEEADRGWYRWSPGKDKDIAYRDIAKAVADFEPVDRKAGHAAANWLQTKAIKDYPATATWLHYEEGRIEGFFAIRSGSFRISNGPVQRIQGGVLKPASDLTWLCKHAEAKIEGQSLIRRAASIAIKVSLHQGNIALVIDPFDLETSELLRQKHSFLAAARSGQLWLPVLAPKSWR